MSNKEHVWIPRLKQQPADRLIGRREFIRYSALFGMSAGAAYMWAGKITGRPIAPPARAGELPKGGVLKIAMRVPKIDNPPHFLMDLRLQRGAPGQWLSTRTGVDNVTRPALASKWEASEDLKTWTFTIADINWHDGRPFTAEDAAWNIKHCLRPAATGSSVLGLMKGYMLKEVDSGKKDDKGQPTMSTELWDANAIEVKDQDRSPQPQGAAGRGARALLPLSLPDARSPRRTASGVAKSNGTGAFTATEVEVRRKRSSRRSRATARISRPSSSSISATIPRPRPPLLPPSRCTASYRGQYRAARAVQGHGPRQPLRGGHRRTAVARMQPVKPFDDPKVRQAMRLATDQGKTLELAHRGIGTVAEHHHVSPIHPDYKKIAA